jgi:alpha-beta hydrolase superfamily lysophospholipase
MRRVTIDPPAETGVRDGLAYALFTPAEEHAGGVVILHGASSAKENHYDFARAVRAAGLAAVAYDARGHGASDGRLDDRVLDDLETIARLLPPGPIALRGSSMGGYVALLGAARMHAAAVVAICPASSDHLLRGLRSGELEFDADRPALEAFLEAHDAFDALRAIDGAVLLLHAEGDERIPVEHSRELLRAAASPVKRLIAVPGGHHRSVQHDPELQAVAVRFIAKALARAGAPPRG